MRVGSVQVRSSKIYSTDFLSLVRDRNVTLRKPIMMNSGILDLQMKGMVMEYNK